MVERHLQPRLLEPLLRELVAEVPAVMVTGPRASGKTTLARQVAASVLRLDEPATGSAVAADPDGVLRRLDEPVLVDEWQEVPAVLAAVKRAVDDDPRPGRFVLTGSVEADLTATTWPGTGRVVRLDLHGLGVREILGNPDRDCLVDLLVAGDLAAVPVPAEPPALAGYLELAARSGFPEPALRLGPRARGHWVESYLGQLVTRDLAGQVRDPARMRTFIATMAVSTAGIPAGSTLAEATGLDRRTIGAYDRALRDLYVLDSVPAWSSNRLARLAERPKRYVVDPGLAMAAAGVDVDTALFDPDLRGRLVDTFVMAQLRPELAVARSRCRVHHLRANGGQHEVDVVLDLGRGRVVALEVKASGTPTLRDARHLVWLRDSLGEGFVRGAVLHTGPYPFELAERIWALPVAAFWG